MSQRDRRTEAPALSFGRGLRNLLPAARLTRHNQAGVLESLDDLHGLQGWHGQGEVEAADLLESDRNRRRGASLVSSGGRCGSRNIGVERNHGSPPVRDRGKPLDGIISPAWPEVTIVAGITLCRYQPMGQSPRQYTTIRILVQSSYWQASKLKGGAAQRLKTLGNLLDVDAEGYILPPSSAWCRADNGGRTVDTTGSKMGKFFNIALILMTVAFCLVQKAGAAEEPKEKKLTGKKQVVDFVDNTKNYKGDTITLELEYEGESLRDGLGLICPFEIDDAEAGADGTHDDVKILVPRDLDVPNAKVGSRLWVTFVCGEGSLKTGNKAVKIKRPD